MLKFWKIIFCQKCQEPTPPGQIIRVTVGDIAEPTGGLLICEECYRAFPS